MNELLSKLTDEQVSNSILVLRKEEKVKTLDVLSYLGEVEARSLHLGQGYGSLFSFCVQKLQYSESGANRRIRTARAMRKYPSIRELLHAGQVNLSTVSLVAGVLTDENYHQVLTSIRDKTYREVEGIVSEFAPKKAPREKIKPISVKTAASAPASSLFGKQQTKTFCNRQDGSSKAVDGMAARASEPKVFEKRYEIKFSLNEKGMDEFQEVQHLLSGRFPEGISIEKTIEVLVADFLKRKSPVQKAIRREKRGLKKSRSATKSVPAAVRDAVFVRDGGCCSYVSSDGTRCGSTWDLELDHIRPRAAGGGDEFSNLRLLCRKHNLLAAERHFGKNYIAGKMAAGG